MLHSLCSLASYHEGFSLPTQTRSPTAVLANTGNWSNPTYALGTHDNLCASKRMTILGVFDLQVGTYLFNIPLGSTITRVEYGFHAFIAYGLTILATCRIQVWHGGAFEQLGAYGGVSGDCSSCLDSETVWTSNPWTVDDLNNENFQTILQAVRDGGLIPTAYVDWVWMRATYTPPAIAKKPRGDGLVWRR